MKMLVLLLAAVAVSASPLVLNCPGSLQDLSGNPAITFGGSGIPKTAVCFGVFGDVALALTATQRFDNPPVANNGVDTFLAGTGDDSAHGKPLYAVWNFDWYISNSSSTASYLVDLRWDTNPGAATDVSQFGHLSQTVAAGATVQDSWNLGFGFVSMGASNISYSPAAGPFDPQVGGEYGFAINIVPLRGHPPVGGIAMQVNAGTPEPTSMVLLGSGFLVLFIVEKLRRRRRR